MYFKVGITSSRGSGEARTIRAGEKSTTLARNWAFRIIGWRWRRAMMVDVKNIPRTGGPLFEGANNAELVTPNGGNSSREMWQSVGQATREGRTAQRVA
jgi:hypothetical protein